MKKTLVAAVVGLFACLLVAVPAASAYTPPPVVPWETLLPPLPTAQNPQFQGVPGCTTPSMACIDNEISTMDSLRLQFGCDHRAVFDTTYELLTMTLRDMMNSDPHLFADPNWVIGEDATFAQLYYNSLNAYEQGQPVPEAWKIAFDTAAHGDANGPQDMLLGINAHVQRDMPYMLASVGLRAPDGTSHKPDHDKFNEVLNQAYARVVDTIAKRFDPIENLQAPSFNPALGLAGNVSGDQLVQAWREGVWRNAERLLNAPNEAARQRVELTIEANAAASARAIAAIQVPPGYRAQRDAYCATHNVGPLG